MELLRNPCPVYCAIIRRIRHCLRHHRFLKGKGRRDTEHTVASFHSSAEICPVQTVSLHTFCTHGDHQKTADVSVAMGSMGSDIAVDAAEIALMSDDLSKIPYLKWLSDATVRTIKTSITLSMCINFAAIVLSLMNVLTPTTGALVHNAGSCLVVLIAALLYDRKFD